MIISDLYQTKIKCSKYRLSLNETITVTVKLEDFNRNPVTGKSVTLSVDFGKIMGVLKGNGGNIATGGKSVTVTTASDGEISISYKAQDMGLCTFVANATTLQVLVGWEKISVLMDNKWYNYSNDGFTFDNKRGWNGKLSIAYNPVVNLARLYFSFDATPFTGKGTKQLGANSSGQYGFSLGDDSEAGKSLISTALRPRIREMGFVHFYDNTDGKGDSVVATLDTEGVVKIVNSVDKAVANLHGMIMYRYADKYNVIRNKFLEGTLSDVS